MAATTLLSDNGASSGLSGYTLTGGSDGTLELQTTSVGGTPTTAMSINNSQVVTFANPPVGVDAFPSGTVMLFLQTAAPTGWTKSTAHDNKALRVVSGTAGSGGSVAFTTAFASQAVAGTVANTTAGGSVSVSGTVGGTTLTTSQIPSHNHLGGSRRIHDASDGEYGNTGIVGTVSNPLSRFSSAQYKLDYTSSTGSGGSHDHSFSGSGSFTGTAHNHTFTGTAINLAVQYVDTIIATKN